MGFFSDALNKTKNFSATVADPMGYTGAGDWNIKSAYNKLIGKDDVNAAQEAADRAARAQYDTNQLNPKRAISQQMAAEGIRDQDIRNQAVNKLLATDNRANAALYGGNAAAMITGVGAADQSRMDRIAEIEYQLAIQDAQAKLQGEVEYANTTGDMLKMKAALKSTLELNKAQASAEIGRRKQALIGGLLQTAGTIAGAYVGGPMGAAAANKLTAPQASQQIMQPQISERSPFDTFDEEFGINATNIYGTQPTIPQQIIAPETQTQQTTQSVQLPAAPQVPTTQINRLPTADYMRQLKSAGVMLTPGEIDRSYGVTRGPSSVPVKKEFSGYFDWLFSGKRYDR